MAVQGLSERSFDSLFRRDGENAVDAAFRIVGDQALAEDLAQEAFARLWAKRKAVSDIDHGRHFMLTTVRRLALNARRDLRIRREKLASCPPPRVQPSPLDDLALRELQERVADVVSSLSPRRRQVFLLTFVRGQSPREAATALGLSAQTIANERTTIRNMMRALLDLKG
jgi:RNA polymerase sigma-70 factor (ECF subfamily)